MCDAGAPLESNPRRSVVHLDDPEFTVDDPPGGVTRWDGRGGVEVFTVGKLDHLVRSGRHRSLLSRFRLSSAARQRIQVVRHPTNKNICSILMGSDEPVNPHRQWTASCWDRARQVDVKQNGGDQIGTAVCGHNSG